MDKLADNLDYRLFCEERLHNPYPLFDHLRSEDPVHWSEPLRMWLVTRYDDVATGLRDTRLSSNRTGMYLQALTEQQREQFRPLLDHIRTWIQLTDEPDHTRLRKLVTLAFTPKMINSLRSQIETLAEQLLDTVPRGVPFDIARVYSYPLPATVISGMLGIPVGHRDRFVAATEKLMRFSSRAGQGLNRHAEGASTALGELVEMFEVLLAERRVSPKEDLLSALASAESEGERLSSEELLGMCVFLFLAGHETTTSAITSATLTLLTHPEELEKLQDDLDGRISTTVEETLRYESPVPRAVRQAREDLQIEGKEIQAGQLVVFLLGAANRDPAQFPKPERFDIMRRPNRHLAFGLGPHFCLGGPLARLEIEIALRSLVSRFPGLRLAGGPLSWKPVMGVRALEALPVIAP